MNELEIPEVAYEAAERACRTYVADVDALDVASDAINIAAPIIVAAELRRLADDLHELRQSIREEDGRSIRSSAMAEGIARLRNRADELVQQGKDQ